MIYGCFSSTENQIPNENDMPRLYTISKWIKPLSCCNVTLRWAATWQNHQSGCPPGEGSDQPGHSPSLIRVFAVRMKKAWVLSYPLSAQRRLWSDWESSLCAQWVAKDTAKTLIRLGGCPVWSESLLGAHSFCWFCHVEAQITMTLDLDFWLMLCRREEFSFRNVYDSMLVGTKLNLFTQKWFKKYRVKTRF